MLLQPFLGALLALRAVSWPVVPALACVLLVFLIREPLTILARQRWIWREPHPETREARATFVVEFALLLVAAGALAFAWPVSWLVMLGAAAALLTALAVYITIKNRQRAVWFQALSAAGLSASCLAACLAVTGQIPLWCWGWWVLNAVHFFAGILIVHVRLDARLQARRNGLVDARLRREAAVMQGVEDVGAIALLLTGSYYYGAALALSALVHLYDLRTAYTPASIAMPMTKVGLRALTVSIVFTLVLVAGVWLG